MPRSLVLSSFALYVLASPARAQFCPGTDGWVFGDVLASDPFCGYHVDSAERRIARMTGDRRQ